MGEGGGRIGERRRGGWGRGTGVILGGDIDRGTEKPTTGIGKFFLNSTFSTTFFYCSPHKDRYRYKIISIYGPMIYDLFGLVHNAFDAGKSITWAVSIRGP